MCRCQVNTSTEDARKRADRRGRSLHRCAVCGREFLTRGIFSSQLGPRVTVCGVLLNPPVAKCMLADDFGKLRWPEDKPMPDLVAIQQRYDERHAAHATR